MATRVLRKWLTGAHVRAGRHGALALLALARAGRGAVSVGGMLIRAQSDHLFVEGAPSLALPLPVPGRLSFNDMVITSRLKDSQSESDLGDGRLTVAFDADHLHSELEVRSWRAGDRFYPFGMGSEVKVGDLFTNLKVPRALRPSWPLVWCGQDIAWVVGLRRAALAPVTPATRRIVNLEVNGALVRKAW
ncbi:MAG: tRNA lysidine(34) synthetase TilS [Deltaproteobacteria bacterium]|nr:tRNA lysidine(34) synthetase TilS [Deltaproteobacteria bacterium]